MDIVGVYEQAKTVVFYSISNCHPGLAGITFGNFLIKNVVEELKNEMPWLKTFVTLSPVPGFRKWLLQADLDPGATRVRVTGFDEYSTQSDFSTPGAAWIFTLEQVAQTGMFLATSMNGLDLPLDHGFPVRLLVPGWYGWSQKDPAKTRGGSVVLMRFDRFQKSEP